MGSLSSLPTGRWAVVRGWAGAAAGAAIASALVQGAAGTGDRSAVLLRVGLWIVVGAAAGSLAAGLQRHPRRALGLVPFGATGLTAVLVAAAAGARAPWVWAAVGAAGGLVNVAFEVTWSAATRSSRPAGFNAAGYLGLAVGGAAVTLLAAVGVLSPTGELRLVAGLAGLSAGAAWVMLYRDACEQVVEISLWPMHRVRGNGPGLIAFPRQGPVLVVANHSAWFDPAWLAKVLPRRLTPMMTSVFYDLPGLRWWVRHVFRSIRVESSTYRREAPELAEAIAALDRGECVVLFPEGMLKRRADQPLRQFGQGVWHILRERPGTPVVACWIEGGWGSYTSYCGGPPTVGKRIDWWRRIDVAVAEPVVLDVDLLQDQRGTRTHLMQACLGARRHLGLEVVQAGEALDEERELQIEN